MGSFVFSCRHLYSLYTSLRFGKQKLVKIRIN